MGLEFGPVEIIETEKTRRQHILDALEDTVSRFLYYDRKEDEDLPRSAIEQAVASGEITIHEMIVKFSTELRKNL